MTTKEALTQIFNKLNGTTKWQLDFYRNFQKFFDSLDFNQKVINRILKVQMEDQ